MVHPSAREPARRRLPLPLPASSLVVPALAGIGGAAFLAWKPGVARSMVGSPRAFGFTLVVASCVLAGGWLLPRLGRGWRTTAAAQLVPVLAAFLVTVAPAFRQVSVDEAFPAATPGVSASPDAGTHATPRSGVVAPDRAIVLGRSELHGIDHRASGEALLLRRADGSLVVRLAQLDVEPGPDYQVHLVPGAARREPGDGVRLDRLRGNRGNQNYNVPKGFRVTTPVTVLVWCRAFAVPVAAATIL
jgi:hypothetical protein